MKCFPILPVSIQRFLNSETKPPAWQLLCADFTKLAGMRRERPNTEAPAEPSGGCKPLDKRPWTLRTRRHLGNSLTKEQLLCCSCSERAWERSGDRSSNSQGQCGARRARRGRLRAWEGGGRSRTTRLPQTLSGWTFWVGIFGLTYHAWHPSQPSSEHTKSLSQLRTDTLVPGHKEHLLIP